MSLYVGINNTPKSIVSLLIGKDGSATQASSAYTGGVNSKSLVYNSFNLDKELTKINPVGALCSGKINKDDIGKTVYLSNSYSKCQEWRIADVNHDDTKDTVDLFPKYTLGIPLLFAGRYTYHNDYGKSYPRQYLNNEIYNGFDDKVQSLIIKQKFTANGSTYTDKVKCPSLNEVGCNPGLQYCTVDGYIYPIFGTQQLNQNSLAVYRNTSNNYADYYTRSACNNGQTSVYSVKGSTGTEQGISTSTESADSIACIRFSKLELIMQLAESDPVDVLTSGKITEDYIGFPVTLTNAAVNCQEWVIADVNHDGTEGTVDLVSKYTLLKTIYGDKKSYKSSKLREILNGSIYDGFSDVVKNAIIEQDVQSEKSILKDKMKAPSFTELGFPKNSYYMIEEGSAYPLFCDDIDNRNIKYTKLSSTYECYWTRNQDTDSDYPYRVYTVNYNGNLFTDDCRYSSSNGNDLYTIGIIRFGKQ